MTDSVCEVSGMMMKEKTLELEHGSWYLVNMKEMMNPTRLQHYLGCPLVHVKAEASMLEI